MAVLLCSTKSIVHLINCKDEGACLLSGVYGGGDGSEGDRTSPQVAARRGIFGFHMARLS